MTETIPVVEDNTPTQLGGKKKNGHKAICKCPICINMKYANRSKYSKRRKHNKQGRTKRKRGGANSPDINSDSDDSISNLESEEENLLVEEAEADEEEEEGATSSNIPTTSSGTDDNVRTFGGSKKNKKNGHKANCKCPICKNIKKGKHGGEGEGESEDKGNEVKATDKEYDALMEGGKRSKRHKKRTRRHKKTHRKQTRRNRKN